jgi:hypothetical protein
MDARLVPGEANDLNGDTGARDIRLEWSAFAPNKARQSLVLANVRNRNMLAAHHDIVPGFKKRIAKRLSVRFCSPSLPSNPSDVMAPVTKSEPSCAIRYLSAIVGAPKP